MAQVAPISEEAALHQSGHFVLQKVMIVADSAELLPVARSLIRSCMEIATSKQGIHVMIKVVDKMVRWPFSLLNLLFWTSFEKDYLLSICLWASYRAQGGV